VNIGILGGSFDPVHNGHLSIANDALAGAPLDKLLFVPAAQAPLKGRAPSAPAADRLAMLRLALGDNPPPHLEISDIELRRGGVSYSVDTARELHRLHPRDTLFWLIGADQAARLKEWRDIRALAELVTFLVMGRPGCAPPAPNPPPWLRLRHCPGRLLDISSTTLRERLRMGLPVDGLMPPLAVEHALKNRLYRDA
jgi:nicotinate-nucleotide adenylyltransferase